MAETDARRPDNPDDSALNHTVGMDESMERSLQQSTTKNPVSQRNRFDSHKVASTLPDIQKGKQQKARMRLNPREHTDKKSPSVRTQKKGLSFFDTAKLMDPEMYEDSDLDITLTDFAKFKGWMKKGPEKKVQKLDPILPHEPEKELSVDSRKRSQQPGPRSVIAEEKRSVSIGQPVKREPELRAAPVATPAASTDSKKRPWLPARLPDRATLLKQSFSATQTQEQPAASILDKNKGLLDRFIDPSAPQIPVLEVKQPAPPEPKPQQTKASQGTLAVEKDLRLQMLDRHKGQSSGDKNVFVWSKSRIGETSGLVRTPAGKSGLGLASKSKGGESRTKVSNEWLFGADPKEQSRVSEPNARTSSKTKLAYKVLDDFEGKWSPRNRIDMLYPQENETTELTDSQIRKSSPLDRYYLDRTKESSSGDYAYHIFDRGARKTFAEDDQTMENTSSLRLMKGILPRYIYSELRPKEPEIDEVDEDLFVPIPPMMENPLRDEFDEESDYDMKQASEVRKKRVLEVAKLLNVDEIIKERRDIENKRMELLAIESLLKHQEEELRDEKKKLLAPPEPEPVYSPRSGWVMHYEPKPRLPSPDKTKYSKPAFTAFGKSVRYEEEFFHEELSRKSKDFKEVDFNSDLGELEFEKLLIKFEELEELRRQRAARKKARDKLKSEQINNQQDSRVSSRKPSVHDKALKEADSNPGLTHSINKSFKMDSDARINEGTMNPKEQNFTAKRTDTDPITVEIQNLSFNQSFKYVPVETLPGKTESEFHSPNRSKVTLKPLETPLLDQYAFASVEGQNKAPSSTSPKEAYNNVFGLQDSTNKKKPAKQTDNPKFYRSQDQDEHSKSILDPGSSVFKPVLAAMEPTKISPDKSTKNEPKQSRIPFDMSQPPKPVSPKIFYSEPYIHSEEPKVTVNSIRFKKNPSKKKDGESTIPEEFEDLLITPEMISSPPPTIETARLAEKGDPVDRIGSQKVLEPIEPLPPIEFLPKEESRPSQPRPQRVAPEVTYQPRQNSMRSPLDKDHEAPARDAHEDGIRPPRVSSTNLQGRPSEPNRLNESLGAISSTSKNQAVRSPQRIVMSQNKFMKNRTNTHKRIPISDGGPFEPEFGELNRTRTESITFSPPQQTRKLQTERS